MTKRERLLKTDNQQLLQIVNRLSHLNFKYPGSFRADLRPRYLPKNTFRIIKTDPFTQPGSHWTLLANKGEKLFYGYSMGEMLQHYSNKTKSNFVSIVQEKLQDSESCDFYIFRSCTICRLNI